MSWKLFTKLPTESPGSVSWKHGLCLRIPGCSDVNSKALLDFKEQKEDFLPNKSLTPQWFFFFMYKKCSVMLGVIMTLLRHKNIW